MPNQHKRAPLGFRPPEAERQRLREYAERTGMSVGQVLTEALREYLDRAEAQAATQESC